MDWIGLSAEGRERRSQAMPAQSYQLEVTYRISGEDGQVNWSSSSGQVDQVTSVAVVVVMVSL